jgi:peptide/nickel transport system permease protein
VTTTAATPQRRFWAGVRYWLGSWKLSTGLALVLALVLFSLIGSFFEDYGKTRVGWGDFSQRPSAKYPLGTDNVGRDILALMVYGIPPSLEIGIIAGGLGTIVGTILGSTAGYFGGRVDTVIRTCADITLTIPSLMVLVVLASYMRTTTIEMTAIIVAVFAWAGPTRSVRAQALSLRERAFIPLAKLSGQGNFEIIVRQILPNLLPYIMAGFVGSVSGGILASVGIQILGLGPLFTPNLGMILQYAFNGAALFRNMWWWWGPPALALILLFIGLFLISMSLDEFANPRLRERVVREARKEPSYGTE